MRQTYRHLREGLGGWASALLRLQRLLLHGLYLMLWSKIFTGHRAMAPLEAAVLKLKSIDRLPPELEVTDGKTNLVRWQEGFGAVYAALFLNFRTGGRLSKRPHAHPAPAFPAVYLWDSAFIAQVWKWWDPQVAWEILRSVVDLRDGARLQHFVADFARSSFTQPPLIAWSLQSLQGAVGPATFEPWARHAYRPLRDYLDWLNCNRRLPGGLYAWAHPYESGVENAPRFSSRDERRMDDTKNLAAPDFATYMILKYEALSSLAGTVGRDDEAAALNEEAAELRAKINATLWDEHEGLYFDRDPASGEFVRARTIASLLPLWAGIPDEHQAERLVEHIMDPEAFNTVIPLPSVSLADPAFEKDMWRGPVWLNTAFAVIAGLRRYGYDEAASDLAFRLCDGIYRSFEHTGHFYEFYDPERHDISELHRKRGNRWKRLTLGAKPVAGFVGWSGLVNTIVIETLFGVKQRPDALTIQPRFPHRAAGQRFLLRLPRYDLTIDIEIGHDRSFRGTYGRGEDREQIAGPFGASISLPSDLEGTAP